MGPKVELYTKKDCSLCVVAREIILRILTEVPFEFQEVDIESRGDLYASTSGLRRKFPLSS
jgi:glutaredoxin